MQIWSRSTLKLMGKANHVTTVWLLRESFEITPVHGFCVLGKRPRTPVVASFSVSSPHTVDCLMYDPFIKSRRAYTPFTLGSFVVKIWSRSPSNSRGVEKPA